MDNQIKKLELYNLVIHDIDHMKTYLEKKHTSRYIELIKFIRANGLVNNDELLNYLYRADVVIRREISEILKPIEIWIATKICYWLEENKFKIKDYYCGIFFEDVSSVEVRDNRWYANKAITKQYTIHTMMGINKNGAMDKEPWLIVNEMTFGQLSAFISLLPEESISDIFKGIELKKADWEMTIEDIVCLRNHIAHHSLLFTNKKVYSYKRKVMINDLIDSLCIIAKENYRERLQNSIIRYRDNMLKKHKSDFKHISEEDILKMFDKIISFLL